MYAESASPAAMTITPQLEDATAELDALLHHAAITPLGDLGWLRVTGDDRVRWLNGMVTNSINDLKPGQGNYNFLLNAQGRIQADAYAFATEESLLLETASPGGVATLLDWFIIMDDVELEVVCSSRADAEALHKSRPFPTDRSGFLLAGPKAEKLLATLGFPTALEISLTTVEWQDSSFDLITAHSPLVPRFELWSDAATIAALTKALTAASAIPVTSKTLEALRILEGTPRYGTDIRDKELPQETAQTRALHFAKGCYLGQEIVERIRSRGQVHRTFTGFRLTGTLPPSGTPLQADGKSVGELTSVASFSLRGEPIQFALGYIRRETLDQGMPLTYPGGEAISTTLPFAIS